MKYKVKRAAGDPAKFEVIGEFGFEELRSLHQAGVVKDADLFAVVGKTDWARVGALFPKVGATGKPAPAADGSRETRGRDSARVTKIIGASLACGGTLLVAFNPGVGCFTLSLGLVIFICGRFQE
jgi:hypothetical protein